ncbi:hypothetical protein V1506DRAFT_226921 [Lipomyces tetrasporus]
MPSSNPSHWNQLMLPKLSRGRGVSTLQLVYHYVTPKFYTETKPTSGKVVPTCDYYSAVQVYGAARIYFDTRSKQVSDFSRSSCQISHCTQRSPSWAMEQWLGLGGGRYPTLRFLISISRKRI